VNDGVSNGDEQKSYFTPKDDNTQLADTEQILNSMKKKLKFLNFKTKSKIISGEDFLLPD
jgi:hypothetical protein